MNLSSLKKILKTDAEVIRNKDMVSIHMSKENYEVLKDEISEVPFIDDDEVLIKAKIECKNPG